MIRRHVFKDSAGAAELTLPVTPSSYQWETAQTIQQLEIEGLGDINLPGQAKLYAGSIECMFPARAYAFAEGGAAPEPQYYIDRFERWVQQHTVLRYIVTGTDINAQVLVESIQYREQDGTNDVYAKISLREYRQLQAELLVPETAETPAENEARPSDTGSEARTHTVVRGDTLWAICRQYYGEPTLYAKLASYNGVKNANLIYPGQVLQIPPKEKLAETAVTCSTAAIVSKPAPSTTVELGGKTYGVVNYGNKDDPLIIAAQLSRSGVLNYIGSRNK